jgi:RNA polymerase sigma-70 factor (ECF subfamily)
MHRTNTEQFLQRFLPLQQMLFSEALALLGSKTDAEDAVQETFFRLIRRQPHFENPEHEKAWLIRTASNICKNELKHWRRRQADLDAHADLPAPEQTESGDIMDAIMSLPERCKTVIYLYYYEGYQTAEIAKMLRKPHSTIRNHLREARLLLKERLGDEI